MLFPYFFLLPIVFVSTSELTINDYVIRIENNTLTSVQATKSGLKDLDLSNLEIQHIDKDAFRNLVDLKILSLANNSLTDLPESVFSNLKNLHHLSLVSNNLKYFNGAFIGLGNLKTLNISNNPVKSFGSGELYGLNNTIDISTLGISLDNIATTIFNDTPPDPRRIRWNIKKHLKGLDLDTLPETRKLDEAPSFQIQICIHDGKVELVDYMKKNESLSVGCHEIKTVDTYNLTVDNFGITEFKEGWYRINYYPANSLDGIVIRGNNISRVTRGLLNDLPNTINSADLSGNKIERLETGIIRNPYIHYLNLNNNSITEIEDGALKGMDLSELSLNDNRINSTRFIATLPSSIVVLYLDRNNITELSNLPVLNFPQLRDLFIRENKITIVRRNSLRGLKSLLILDLSKNRIQSLEPGCFEGINNVYWLTLRDNDITHLDGGVFNGLSRLIEIDLGKNKLTRITEGFRDSLPHNLEILSLDNNLIESLEPGSFVNSPKWVLYLQNNKISKIAKWSFYVPDLYGKDSEHPPLNKSKLLGPLYAGNQLATLLNSDPIPERPPGIGSVILSGNPIKILENGAFFGIIKDKGNAIYISRTPLELIQGGLFDDV